MFSIRGRVRRKVANKKINEGVHEHGEEAGYIYPTEPEVLANLENFQDMKLGFMTHFGMYSQMGIMESWPVVDDIKQNRWAQKDVDWIEDDQIEEFKRQYWSLNESFNPTRFDPKRYAESIAGLGFKYTVIPTKHHDGFCLWDTNQTDYKSTDPSCPYHVNQHADIYGALTNEFSRLGLVCGAYFSKPDFHDDRYWTDEFRYGTDATRSVAYDINQEPERWEAFKQFTEEQMREVISNYAKVDILWLDGGQVIISNNEDIKMDEIVERLRTINPGLIVVDRIAGTKNENYLTPEATVMDRYVSVPWESCIPAGKHFGFRYEDVWKTPLELTKIFTNIICKGGNLVLNIPTQPDGRLPRKAMENVGEFTDWVKAHDYAIYGSRPVAPYFSGNQGIVKGSNGKKYIFVPAGEIRSTPKYVYIQMPIDIKQVKYNNVECEIYKLGQNTRVTLPAGMQDQKAPLCYVFEVEVND